jgi:polyhydroxyalkanoate synthesis regulator phasin
MNNMQLFLLMLVPLVGILANTGLFLHVSNRVDNLADRMDRRFEAMDRRYEAMQADMKDLNKAMSALEMDVAKLKDKVGI